MAKTRLEFRTYVLYDFKRTDKDTELYQAYNDTIKHIANLHPNEGLKYQSWIPTVAGQEDYTLPATKCHVIHPIRFIESSTSSAGYPLIKTAKEEFSEMFPNPNATGTAVARGKPTHYCIYSNSILIGKLPDVATYILEMDWSKLPTSQDAASDLQELGTEWEEVLKWGTLARLYESVGLTGEADRYWALYRDAELGYPALIQKEKDQTEVMGKVRVNNL